MGMLQILPWCKLKRAHQLGRLVLQPLTLSHDLPYIDRELQATIRTMVAPYRGLDGGPVESCVILYWERQDPVRDLTAAEVSESGEIVQLACFSSLAFRRFFGEPYSNSACFIRVVQRFQDSRGIAIETRRRDGSSLSGRILPRTVFGVPPHAAAVHEVAIDHVLAEALIAHRSGVTAGEWARFQNAIDCFNFANSDDDAVPSHVEWVMLAGAFQRITGSASDADAVASALDAVVVPEVVKFGRDASLRQISEGALDRSLRWIWLREFYSLRGEYAHGRLSTNRQHAWEPFEHLLLSAIAFPLLVKCLLATSSRYVLTDDDWAQVDAFERLLDSQFLVEPVDSNHSGDWTWVRLQSESHGRRSIKRSIEDLLDRADSGGVD